jgi:uncharacterized membrane protein
MNSIPTNDSQNRVETIDLLRGLVMVFMALDHIRDYFYYLQIDPTDLDQTTPVLFFTRWITHFCAPVFVFLAGTSAFLSQQKRGKKQLSFLLLKRGIWLILLEFTIILHGWTFNFSYSYITLQVIWVIGCSMIMLSVLIYLPYTLLFVFSLAMVLGHHLFDGVTADQFGSFGWIWNIVHQRAFIPLNEHTNMIVIYPLIPWIGVMALGYCFGTLYLYPQQKRIIILFRSGLGICFFFFILRWMNIYGDLVPWSWQGSPVYSILSFLNCTKYPPSLLFLCMTLGPAFVLLAAAERHTPLWTKPLLTIGKVPMLYYILHIYVIHGLAVILAFIQTGEFLWMMDYFFVGLPREDYGLHLWGVYGIWFLVLLIMYPICYWYARLKIRYQSKWFSYI